MNNDDDNFNKSMAQRINETGNKNDYNYYSHSITAADLKKIYANADRQFLNDFFGEENMRNMTGDDTSLLDKADDTKFLLTYQAISAERTGTPMQVDIDNGTIRMLDNRLL